MKTWIIDYTYGDGRKNWQTVRAESAEKAVSIFRAAGIDGWTGCNFADYEITAVTER